MKSNLKDLMVGWVLLVPTLGLMSCAKDSSPGQKQTPADDPWKLTAPEIHAPNSNDPIGFNKAAGTTFDSGAVLTFQGEEVANTVFTANSQCQLGDRIEKQSVRALNVAKIPVMALFPAKMMIGLKEKELEKVVCTTDLSVTNNIGSDYEFSLNRWSIGSSKVKTLSTETRDTHSSFQLISDIDYNDLPKAWPYRSNMRSTIDWILDCENFSAQLDKSSLTDPNQAMSALLFGDVVKSKTGETEDPRTIKPQQVCSLTAMSVDDETGAQVATFHAVSTVALEMPKAEIVYAPILRNMTEASFKSEAFMAIDIYNKNSAPIGVRIREPQENWVYFQGATYNGTYINVGAPMLQMLSKIEVTGYSLRLPQDTWVDYEIPGKSTLHITAKLRDPGKLKCLEAKPVQGKTPEGQSFIYDFPANYFAGMYYAYHQSLSIEQFRHWNTADKVHAGEMANLELNEMPIINEKADVQPGWAPSSTWYKDHGDQRPQDNKYRPLTIEQLRGPYPTPFTCSTGYDPMGTPEQIW